MHSIIDVDVDVEDDIFHWEIAVLQTSGCVRFRSLRSGTMRHQKLERGFYELAREITSASNST